MGSALDVMFVANLFSKDAILPDISIFTEAQSLTDAIFAVCTLDYM